MEPIKNIWTSFYTLTEQLSKKDRPGLLIKVLFSTGRIGYNCLHPLSSFKEGSLSDYIQILKNTSTQQIAPKDDQTALLHTILQDAYMDADARSKNQSLLFGYPPLQNHCLISNIKQPVYLDRRAFSVFKVKMGSQLREETINLRRMIKNTKKKFSSDWILMNNYRKVSGKNGKEKTKTSFLL